MNRGSPNTLYRTLNHPLPIPIVEPINSLHLETVLVANIDLGDGHLHLTCLAFHLRIE